MQSGVAIIILNYNSSAETLNLISSIRKYERNYHIIVVDNASSEKECAKLSSLSDNIEIIWNQNNLGYAVGNNIGLKRAIDLGYEYFLIANSDVEIIYPHTIADLMSYMKKNSADIVAPMLIDGTGELDSGIIVDSKTGRTKRLCVNEDNQCRSVIGAFWILSKKVISVNGFLPEEYFLYREETDYMVSASRKDLKIYYIPEVAVIHRHGTTTSSIWDYYFNRNTIYYARKIWNTNLFFLAIYHFLKTVYVCLMIILGIEKRKNKKRAIMLSWKGYTDGVKGITGKLPEHI